MSFFFHDVCVCVCVFKAVSNILQKNWEWTKKKSSKLGFMWLTNGITNIDVFGRSPILIVYIANGCPTSRVSNLIHCSIWHHHHLHYCQQQNDIICLNQRHWSFLISSSSSSCVFQEFMRIFTFYMSLWLRELIKGCEGYKL